MKELACIACYHENLSSLKETIKIYSENLILKLILPVFLICLKIRKRQTFNIARNEKALYL